MAGTGKTIALIRALSGGGGGGGSQWSVIETTKVTEPGFVSITMNKTWAEIAEAGRTRTLSVSDVDPYSNTVDFYPITQLRIDDDDYGETHYRVVVGNYQWEYDAGSSPDNYPVYTEEGK